ncbi:unnamed protein product [marine sediment metagenome]|uniref:Uncharacterized protein n=1 Tax=marine sediment metagenome TaxID=412755 RepID=X1F193_9ZZZZ
MHVKKHNRQLTLSERREDFVKVGFLKSLLVHPEAGIIIAIANDMISQSCPVAGWAEPILETQSTPAIAANRPDNTCESKIILSTLIPDTLVASLLPPVARSHLPKRLKLNI